MLNDFSKEIGTNKDTKNIVVLHVIDESVSG